MHAIAYIKPHMAVHWGFTNNPPYSEVWEAPHFSLPFGGQNTVGRRWVVLCWAHLMSPTPVQSPCRWINGVPFMSWSFACHSAVRVRTGNSTVPLGAANTEMSPECCPHCVLRGRTYSLPAHIWLFCSQLQCLGQTSLLMTLLWLLKWRDLLEADAVN